jgi:hypothetical protein
VTWIAVLTVVAKEHNVYVMKGGTERDAKKRNATPGVCHTVNASTEPAPANLDGMANIVRCWVVRTIADRMAIADFLDEKMDNGRASATNIGTGLIVRKEWRLLARMDRMMITVSFNSTSYTLYIIDRSI